MRFLFTTLQFVESDFYGRVSERLRDSGHEAVHLTFSRRAARHLARRGFRTFCLPDVMAEVGEGPGSAHEVERIERRYDIPSLRDVYRCDPAVGRLSEAQAVSRTVRHVRALERVIDEVRPEVIVPEVGRETMREVALRVGTERGATALFLVNSPFPRPLRLYVDAYDGPIVAPEEVRPLSPPERDEVEGFVSRFTERAKPILAYRRTFVTAGKLRDFARHVAVRLLHERDNDYLRPSAFIVNYARQKAREAGARRLYEEAHGERPFVYFPLHVTDDYKIERVIPHCADQEYLIRQVADYLPSGHDLVLKEHPHSLGRNPVGMLRRLTRLPNVRLVDPYTSSHELMRRAAAVTVISSTVGLEALLYGKGVLTMGRPYYAGYGVTLDVESFRDLPRAVPAVLHFRPDPERVLEFLHACMRSTYEGQVVWQDDSDANASAVAATLERAAREQAARPVPERAGDASPESEHPVAVGLAGSV
ncbi:MAG: hypothetical protein ACR2LY_05685 [Thermoleophilaceae bacterium]